MLANSGSLHNHRASKHMSKSGYECTECGRVFALRQKYDVHVLAHEGRKPFVCGECGAGFVHKRSLVEHGERKHGGR